jgi:biopolymer transport protein ExbB
MLALTDLINSIEAFMDQGGPVMYAIAFLLLWMWVLIFERVLYYKGALKADIQKELTYWEARRERNSWHAHQIRDGMVSRMGDKVDDNLDMIGAIIALCPLMGLLGTVTGMIDVFSTLSSTGGGDPKAMASGVSKATIPTMAGMVAAISGVFAHTYLQRISGDEKSLFADHLTMDH